jgi:hypothetical protein
MAAITTTPLFRNGNAISARLDNLRNDDVEIYTDLTQAEICLHATNTTGVSCYGNAAALAGFRGKTWQLPMSSVYDDTRLLLWQDDPDSDHWSWTPARDMPGSEFIAALRDVNILFV